MRNIILALLIGVSTLSFATEESEQWWEVRAHDQACVSSNSIDLANFSWDEDNPDPIDTVYLVFFIPNADYSSYEISPLKPEDPRIVMSIQPSGIYFKEKDIITNLTVKTESETYSGQFDEKWERPKNPRFLLVGSPANEIWEQIVEKRSVTIEFDLSTGKHYSVNVKGKSMDRIAKMFAACAS